MSPTQRTLKLLREEGYHARVVEHWNMYARIRQDLWGGDVIALKVGEPVLLVQCTTQDHASERVKKLAGIKEAVDWSRNAPFCVLEVWGWRKVGDRGKRKTWQVDRRRLTSLGVQMAV